MISGFTFIHNGVHGGYPFVEAIGAVMPFVHEMIVVDMQSTDETRQVLEKLLSRASIPQWDIIDGVWESGMAGECLKDAHTLHSRCNSDIIWHFEADEVCDNRLAFAVHDAIRDGATNVLMNRLQVEQNFQRCRWYPEPVHRIFPNDGTVVKEGHTTNIHQQRGNDGWACIPDWWLWDVTNCFRDDWLNRVRQQQELWGTATDTHTLYVPIHTNHYNLIPLNCVDEFIKQEHWTWKRSPFDLPDSLKKLVGKTSYKEILRCQQLIS